MRDFELVPYLIKDLTPSEASFIEVLRRIDDEINQLMAGVA